MNKTKAKLVVYGKQVWVSAERKFLPAAVFIEGEKIVSIRSLPEDGSLPSWLPVASTASCRVIKLAPRQVLLPGVVDSHVHSNEPGRTEWEGFWTVTRAAARGGITCIGDMPLNSIPSTTSVPALQAKQRAARNKLWVDMRFIGGAVPGNTGNLRDMLRHGSPGFKCFLINSGVDEFQHVSIAEAGQALQELKGTGAFLMFHAEMEDGAGCNHAAERDITTCGHKTPKGKQTGQDEKAMSSPSPRKKRRTETGAAAAAGGSPKQYSMFHKSRPTSMEGRAIENVIALAKKYNVHCHIVHLSSADALPMIRKARAEGVQLTVETCFHYLTFAAETIPTGSPQFKCCPPIRGQANQDKLWAALMDGTIDMVVSDHSPCVLRLKVVGKGDFMRAWGGISGVQYGLSTMNTHRQTRNFSFQQMISWMSEQPAKLLGLEKQKGQVAVGFDADLCIFNPSTTFTVTTQDMEIRNKFSAYEGRKLVGKVQTTIVRGNIVYDDGFAVDSMPLGRFPGWATVPKTGPALSPDGLGPMGTVKTPKKKAPAKKISPKKAAAKKTSAKKSPANKNAIGKQKSGVKRRRAP